jgi:hypothetical protein
VLHVRGRVSHEMTTRVVCVVRRQINMPRKDNGQPKGFAFVQFVTVAEAARAIAGATQACIVCACAPHAITTQR